MLKPLIIGNLQFPTNLIQGPLAGYSSAPFRQLVHQFGGVAYATTEMISAYALAHASDQPKRYTYRADDEGLLCYQISGNKADDLARAVEKVVALGADLVDLNCGCPQRKIRKKGHGSKLLSDPETLYHLLVAMRSVASLPMSVKIRVDGDSGERFNHEVVDAIQSSGMDFMIVHGRHWQERYDMPVRFDEIAQIVSLADIPVIANGDVDDLASLQSLLTETQADGVMISKGSIGRPWLFAQLQSEFKGELFSIPDALAERQIFLKHVQGLAELDGEHRALLQARGLVEYYSRVDLERINLSSMVALKDSLR
jgi:tRNA-dihydrouridine synthase B